MEDKSPGNVLLAKEHRLKEILSRYHSLMIAYSGGVDSSYLAEVANEVLGDGVHMVLLDSPNLPQKDRDAALQLAQERGWTVSVAPTTEFETEAFLNNDLQRCLYCKREKYRMLVLHAKEHGYGAVACGEHVDDRSDKMRVSLHPLSNTDMVAPLAAAGLTKQEVRTLARHRGLSNWNKPSNPCLVSRFAAGERLTRAAIEMVRDAEARIRALGFESVRVHPYGSLCLIELSKAEFRLLLDEERRMGLVKAARDAGYRQVTVDLDAFSLVCSEILYA